MQLKPPTTFEQQVDLLKEKGFVIKDEFREFFVDFLKSVNYYSFTAYLLPFRNQEKEYRKGTEILFPYNMYQFDRLIRNVIFSAIEVVELNLRTQIAYYHAHKYGAEGYLNPENFNEKHNAEKFHEMVNECIKNNEKTLIVQHHQNEYGGKFPIWVMIEFFSLGMLSHFYGDMKTEDQKKIALECFDVLPNVLRSWLRCLTDLRNRCAHYSRLYYWKFSALPAFPARCAAQETRQLTRRLYDQMMMLKYMFQNKEDWNNRIVTNISAAIEQYADYIQLGHIGFPDDWEEKLRFE